MTEASKQRISPRAPKGGWPLVEQPECKHTPHPEGYFAYHEWAEEKSKTHTQHRCPPSGHPGFEDRHGNQPWNREEVWCRACAVIHQKASHCPFLVRALASNRESGQDG